MTKKQIQVPIVLFVIGLILFFILAITEVFNEIGILNYEPFFKN